MKKRIVVISDLHCGHRVGLTPPEYQWICDKRTGHIWQKFAKIQKECWAWYVKKVHELQPVDVLVCNGDALDGRGERSGGVELITGDRNEQIKIAEECIKIWNPANVVMVRGTPYHTGEVESYEDLIAQQLGCKIGDHEWINVNGIIYDFKHFVGSSSVPHTRKTAISRDQLWNQLWADADLQPDADWVVRSHVHYCEGGWHFVGTKEKQGLTTPALQAMGTRFGARRCSGTICFGLIHWDVEENGTWKFAKHIALIRSQRAQALVF